MRFIVDSYRNEKVKNLKKNVKSVRISGTIYAQSCTLSKQVHCT